MTKPACQSGIYWRRSSEAWTHTSLLIVEECQPEYIRIFPVRIDEGCTYNQPFETCLKTPTENDVFTLPESGNLRELYLTRYESMKEGVTIYAPLSNQEASRLHVPIDHYYQELAARKKRMEYLAYAAPLLAVVGGAAGKRVALEVAASHPYIAELFFLSLFLSRQEQSPHDIAELYLPMTLAVPNDPDAFSKWQESEETRRRIGEIVRELEAQEEHLRRLGIEIPPGSLVAQFFHHQKISFSNLHYLPNGSLNTQANQGSGSTPSLVQRGKDEEIYVAFPGEISTALLLPNTPSRPRQGLTLTLNAKGHIIGAGFTMPGIRGKNDDTLLHGEANGHFCGLFDGCGGGGNGSAASELTGHSSASSMQGAHKNLFNATTNAGKLLELWIPGQSTTATGFHIRNDAAHIINIGDSRTTVFRSDNGIITIPFQTRDHSYVLDLINAGRVPNNRIARLQHPQANVLTRTLGLKIWREGMVQRSKPSGEIDQFMIPLQKGDFLVTTSDGIRILSDDEVKEIIATSPDAITIATKIAHAVNTKRYRMLRAEQLIANQHLINPNEERVVPIAVPEADRTRIFATVEFHRDAPGHYYRSDGYVLTAEGQTQDIIVIDDTTFYVYHYLGHP